MMLLYAHDGIWAGIYLIKEPGKWNQLGISVKICLYTFGQ